MPRSVKRKLAAQSRPCHWSHSNPGAARLDFETACTLRAYLTADFFGAVSWESLEGALHNKGFHLRRDTADVFLDSWPTGASICPLSAIGQSLEALERRFGRIFSPAGSSPRLV